MRTRRKAPTLPPPAAPTVPDLEVAPELAAIILLEHALDVVRDALLAEHPTLIDDFRRPEDDGPVLSLANAICLRAPTLRDRTTTRTTSPSRSRPPQPARPVCVARAHGERLAASATSHAAARWVTIPPHLGD